MIAGPEGFVRVASRASLPEGEKIQVRVAGEDLVVYNVKGSLYCSLDFCPHAGYPLSASHFRGKYVKCALHHWEFDLTTGEYTGNPHIRLKRFPVVVVDDDVFVGPTPIPPPPPKPPTPPPSRDDA